MKIARAYKVPGLLLLLMEQTIQMGWVQMVVFKIEVATLCMQHAAVYITLASQDARLPTLSLLYIRDEDS